MNRAALPQAGESQRLLWFCLRFRGRGGGGPGCCGERGEGAYYVTVGYLTKTSTCRQRGDAYSAGWWSREPAVSTMLV